MNLTRRMIMIFTLLFVFLCAFSFASLKTRSENDFLTVRYDGENGSVFKPFKKSEHSLVFFLPAGLQKEKLFFSGSEEINGKDLTSVDSGTVLQIKNGDDDYDVTVFFGENASTLCITTLRKDMDYINSVKGNELRFEASYYDKNANRVFSKSNGTINGRGNNSWNAQKKSYSLSFDDAVSFGEMNAAEKWILIPSSADTTDLNNRIVFRFAGETGFEWVPGNEYVNVYFDGEYNGLYLISERPEISDARLNDTDNIALFKRELSSRLNEVENGIKTENGNVIEISSPKQISSGYKEVLSEKVNQMESSILDEGSERWKEVIDIDSWARCYVIDELFDNIDSGIASAYFYLKQDGKFYRGPIWDYDQIMYDDPESMIAVCKYRQPYSKNDFYYYLNQKELFKQRVKDIFEKEFVPLIDKYLETEIDAIFSETEGSRKMDYLRWDYPQTEDMNAFKDYLMRKSAFMKEYWENEDRFCMIQIQDSRFYTTYSVEKGKTIFEARNFDRSLLEKEYCYAEDGSAFDPNDAINTNIRLDYADKEEVPQQDLSIISRFGSLNILFLFLFFFAFSILFIKYNKRYYGH